MKIIEKSRIFEITIDDTERKELINAFQPYDYTNPIINFKKLLKEMDIL